MKVRLKIWQKVLIAIVGATSLIVLGHLAVLSYTFREGFLGYLNQAEAERVERLAEALETRYADVGSWAFMEDVSQDPRSIAAMFGDAAFRRPFRRSEGPPPGRHEPDPGHRPHRPPGRPPPGAFRRDAGFSVTGADGLAIIGRPPEDEPGLRRDLVVDGQRIGLLFLPARPGPLGMVERQFSERRQRLLNFSAILTLTLAAIVALILSRHLLAPVQKLAGATRKLRGGDYKVRVATTGTDELGALAEDFNELASTLEENQRARRRWVADISHELRTPVAVLRAQVDALEDGLHPMDEKAVGALSGEIDRIARLVDDLGTLAQSDSGTLSYEKERVSLRDVLQTPLDMAAPRLRDAGLTLERDLTQIECVTVLADRDRMHQVIANLLDNSIAYTGSGGIVRVSATATTDTATIVFEDSAPGVEPADLPRLFDRLYRVEASRNRRTGGSGLGLSICASIVRAHGGEISAANADIGGLAVSISMPLVPGHSTHSAS